MLRWGKCENPICRLRVYGKAQFPSSIHAKFFSPFLASQRKITWKYSRDISVEDEAKERWGFFFFPHWCWKLLWGKFWDGKRKCASVRLALCERQFKCLFYCTLEQKGKVRKRQSFTSTSSQPPRNVSLCSHRFRFVYAPKELDEIFRVSKKNAKTLINILSFSLHSHSSFIRSGIIHCTTLLPLSR